MTSTSTYTASNTYTHTDIATVMRRFNADLVMIAQSSGAITEQEAREYVHDAEELAKNGYLKKVDVTLLSNGLEICATQYTVNTTSGSLTTSRPGGVKWPRVNSPHLRIILSYTSSYDASAKEATKKKLKINWTPTLADTSHSSLKSSGSRDYVKNGWGMQREDFAA